MDTIQQQMANALGKNETKNGTWDRAILEGINEIVSNTSGGTSGGNKIISADSTALVKVEDGGTAELSGTTANLRYNNTVEIIGDEYVKVNGVVNYTAEVSTTDDQETVVLTIQPANMNSSILYFKTKVVGVANNGGKGVAQTIEYAVLISDIGNYTQIARPTVSNTITSLGTSTGSMAIKSNAVIITVTGQRNTNLNWNVFVELVASQV
tara:strand:- start:4437 stop:5066 length:630 start_codon:yes stop_codon:yes gene_type:complete